MFREKEFVDDLDGLNEFLIVNNSTFYILLLYNEANNDTIMTREEEDFNAGAIGLVTTKHFKFILLYPSKIRRCL